MSMGQQLNKDTQFPVGKQVSTSGKPRGFRDILFAEAARRERLTADINSYFATAGYELVETPSVEYPETLLRGLGTDDNTVDSDNLRETFRFVDVDGNLIALRSDVTGALARVVATRFTLVEAPYRLRYLADVFREQESLRGSDRQLTQLGLECFGLEPELADTEVLSLALGGAEAAGLNNCSLHISDVRVVQSLITAGTANTDWKAAISAAWRNGDFIRVKELATDGTLPERIAVAIQKLISLRGGVEVLDVAQQLLQDCGQDFEEGLAALNSLRASYTTVMRKVADSGDLSSKVIVDFSLTPHFEYYSGMILELFATPLNGRACVIGSGGRYDSLMEQFGRPMPAAGFSYDLAALERVAAINEGDELGPQSKSTQPSTVGMPPLRIAIPKGKLFDDCVALLEAAGVKVPGLRDPGRTLRLLTDEYDIIIAKPTDVAIYVSRGVADIGIGGRDTLVEADFPLLQLIDLGFGGCEFVVAAPDDMTDALEQLSFAVGTIRVATKYPRLTQSFFDKRGIQVEIVKLNGNIELAPLIGIADVVVDITQTGTTLRENNLRVVERVLPSTARFVAQYSTARTDSRVAELAAKLETILAAKRNECRQ